ncbi:Arf-GAP with Rho-GAP domain, ANK repeat and PH domain-containing protein 1 [Myotis davidii]|uniref:Arf-GAP with Rho-GAP domain, ANK repeat and PH domain-containing protein 1 n=1 Tax=Myotis davidii TaxID=225400 RepID=L5LUC0_MYODS|nr:Arf-GAP with Rho-GAP domain, ANK repeat and PH domain-containing protein 1 [Myotis davidii]
MPKENAAGRVGAPSLRLRVHCFGRSVAVPEPGSPHGLCSEQLPPQAKPEPEEPWVTFHREPLQPPSPSLPDIPPKPLHRFPEFNDPDYNETPEEGQESKKEEPSGEELSDDQGDEEEDDQAYDGIPNGGWHTNHLSSSLPSSLLIPQLPPHPMDQLPGVPTPIAQVIKSGWLDKNPPQGSYIYQRRWVTLDVE